MCVWGGGGAFFVSHMFYISQINSQLQWTSLPLLLALNYANLLSITALVFLLIMGDQRGHDVMHAVKLAFWGSKVDSSRHDGSHADNDIAVYGSSHRDTPSWEIHVTGTLCGESLSQGLVSIQRWYITQSAWKTFLSTSPNLSFWFLFNNV